MLRSLGAAFLAIAMLSQTAAALDKPIAAVESEEAAISISETRWAGETRWPEGPLPWTSAYFRADGVLVYEYDGQVYDNGRWRQRDRLVSFDTNDHYALYVGHVTGGRFEGVMFNKEGLRGTFSFRRQ